MGPRPKNPGKIRNRSLSFFSLATHGFFPYCRCLPAEPSKRSLNAHPFSPFVEIFARGSSPGGPPQPAKHYCPRKPSPFPACWPQAAKMPPQKIRLAPFSARDPKSSLFTSPPWGGDVSTAPPPPPPNKARPRTPTTQFFRSFFFEYSA